jgi:hypothetical protein
MKQIQDIPLENVTSISKCDQEESVRNSFKLQFDKQTQPLYMFADDHEDLDKIMKEISKEIKN